MVLASDNDIVLLELSVVTNDEEHIKAAMQVAGRKFDMDL